MLFSEKPMFGASCWVCPQLRALAISLVKHRLEFSVSFAFFSKPPGYVMSTVAAR